MFCLTRDTAKGAFFAAEEIRKAVEENHRG